jgi:hypothetical protein
MTENKKARPRVGSDDGKSRPRHQTIIQPSKIKAQDQTLPFEPGIKKAEIQMSLGPRNAANGGSIRRPGKTEVLPRLNAGRSLDLGEEGRPAPAYQINRRLK